MSPRIVPLAALAALIACTSLRGEPQSPAGKDSADEAEAARVKVVVADRLRALAQAAEVETKGERDKDADARASALREVLKARQRLIVEWEKTLKARRAIQNPETTPESEAAELTSALERAKVGLARGKSEPSSLLPESFRDPSAPMTEAALGEMKDAVDRAQDAVESLTKEREALAAAQARKTSTPLATAKAERDEVRKRIAALGPRAAEADAAVAAATSSQDREIARERTENLDWETRLEAERLKEVEARIDLETRRAATTEVKARSLDARIDLARATVAALQSAYAARLERQKLELKRAAADEKAKADRAGDPLERYRARRAQELNEIKALVSEKEKELKEPLPVDEHEQAEKADRAAKDFEKLRSMISGGRSSALVAQRLNTSYRKLDAEREAVRRDDLARATAVLARYETELTDLELDRLNDSRGDRAMRENLLAAVPETRRAQARDEFDRHEREHRAADETLHATLTLLEERAEKARNEVLKRLRILDDQHAFIRTHLFWVRDTQPVSSATVPLLRREARDLTSTALAMASEPLKAENWGRMSPRFLLATLGLMVLPYGVHRARKSLRTTLASVPAPGSPPIGWHPGSTVAIETREA